jgi:hypothetical protein
VVGQLLPFLDEINDAFAKTDGKLEVPEKVQSKKTVHTTLWR